VVSSQVVVELLHLQQQQQESNSINTKANPAGIDSSAIFATTYSATGSHPSDPYTTTYWRSDSSSECSANKRSYRVTYKPTYSFTHCKSNGFTNY
jgi:hypothetical protein